MDEAIVALEQLARYYLGPVSVQDRLAFMKKIESVCQDYADEYHGEEPSPF